MSPLRKLRSALPVGALVLPVVAAALVTTGGAASAAPAEPVASSGGYAKVCFSNAEYKSVEIGMRKKAAEEIIGGKADYYYKSGKLRVGQWLACGKGDGPYYLAYDKDRRVADKSKGPCYGRASERAARC